VRENYEAIEADWVRYYNRNLADDLWGQPGIGVRRIAGLIRWLPPEAALWRSNKTSWTIDNELQAATIEMLDALLRAYVQSHSKPTARKPNPVKIPRPWDNAENTGKRRTTLGDLLGQGLSVKRVSKGGEQ
jgi:hypothetical protein